MAGPPLDEAVGQLAQAAERTNRLLQHVASRLDEAARDRERDRERARGATPFDAKQLHPLLSNPIAAVPGLAGEFKLEIPGEFWNEDGDAAVVACPCGHEPVCELAIPTECDCDRFFLWTGDSVRVARYPAADADS